MKLKKLFLLMLFSFDSFARPAWEMPFDEQKWPWVKVGMNTKDNLLVFADFTKLEPTGSNQFIIPVRTKDNDTVYWNRLDCGINKIESLGIYVNGHFSLEANPINMGPNTVGANVMRMICGINSDRSAKIYGIYGSEQKDAFNYYGIILEEIKVNYSNPDAIEIPAYMYETLSGKTVAGQETIIDCKKQTAIWISEPNKVWDITSNDPNVFAYKYMSKLACDYANKNLWSKSNSNKGRDLNHAKEKCSALGFKLKTEKFGNCVLELTK